MALSGDAVQPAGAIAPAAHAFALGAAGTGAWAPQPFIVRNTGNETLRLGPAALEGADAGAFGVAGDACAGVDVAPGQSCTVSVAFAVGGGLAHRDPAAAVGRRAARTSSPASPAWPGAGRTAIRSPRSRSRSSRSRA